jgi:group I intron endonuclease
MLAKELIKNKPPVSNTCGIYAIYCIFNQKIYIGQSKNMYNRISYHKRVMRRNKHENSYLQKIHNKYGMKSLLFVELEQCEKEFLNEKELFYIKLIEKKYLINLKIDGINGTFRLSERSINKMSKSIHKNWESPDYRNKVKSSKFTCEQANEIRNTFCENPYITILAEKYGTSIHVIFNIIRGRSYIKGCDKMLLEKTMVVKCVRSDRHISFIKK